MSASTLSAPASTAVLEVEGLVKHYRSQHVFQREKHDVVHAVDGIDFSISSGTTFALVGESGCGKTTTAMMVLLLEKPTAGVIRFEGTDVTSLRGAALRAYRRSVQAVLQDPYSSLSPRMRVWEIVTEPLAIHFGLGRRELRSRAGDLLEQVGLNADKANSYPHQFSGGQRQRIAIARALALEPRLIVLDEPVSSLDVSIRAQVLNLLVDLQARLGVSYLLIAHDLAIVEHMSHQIAMMYAGQIVETVTREHLVDNAAHPYTRALIAAVPNPDPEIPFGDVVGGEVASPSDPPSGCRFHPRCPTYQRLDGPAVCRSEMPQLVTLSQGHECACHFARA